MLANVGQLISNKLAIFFELAWEG